MSVKVIQGMLISALVIIATYISAYGFTVNLEKEFTVFRINLKAVDLDGIVDENKEENPGAYIHYNIDNDNLNTNQNGDSIADKDETNTVTDENDLKSLKIEFKPSISFEKGKVRLNGGLSKIWISSLKGNTSDYFQQKTWDLSDANQRNEFNTQRANLWVEGYQSGTSNISVEYENENGVLASSDVVKYTFIAATCGRQPNPQERISAELTWPNLIHCEWSITGEATNIYNCIAWSVGITNKWIGMIGPPNDPYELGDEFMDRDYGDNDGVFEPSDVDAFYNEKGYVTASGPNDADVMYYSGFHGAKKKNCNCGDNKWIMFESKCGDWARIEHVYNQLDGSGYGNPIKYYKKN